MTTCDWISRPSSICKYTRNFPPAKGKCLAVVVHLQEAAMQYAASSRKKEENWTNQNNAHCARCLKQSLWVFMGSLKFSDVWNRASLHTSRNNWWWEKGGRKGWPQLSFLLCSPQDPRWHFTQFHYIMYTIHCHIISCGFEAIFHKE